MLPAFKMDWKLYQVLKWSEKELLRHVRFMKIHVLHVLFTKFKLKYPQFNFLGILKSKKNMVLSIFFNFWIRVKIYKLCPSSWDCLVRPSTCVCAASGQQNPSSQSVHWELAERPVSAEQVPAGHGVGAAPVPCSQQ